MVRSYRVLMDKAPKARKRCMGCGHFDNEIVEGSACTYYQTASHWLLEVDSCGVPLQPHPEGGFGAWHEQRDDGFERSN